MNPHDEDAVRERFHGLDETLEDDRVVADGGVPDEARPWLAEQRLVHGLLRALHGDSAAREGRIAAILQRVDADALRQTPRRHWLLVTAAALLLGAFGVWMALPPSLPTAEAAMARAVGELQQPLDRRFMVRLQRVPRNSDAGSQRAGPQQFGPQQFTLTTRPGQRFLMAGRFGRLGQRLGEGRIGCDGTTLWIDPAARAFRRSAPLAEREQLLEGFGELLELGYLDVHDLVAELPGNFRLRVAERIADADGGPALRIVARALRVAETVRLRSVELLVDEASGMITRVDAELFARGLGRYRVELEYLGLVEDGPVDYSRPW